MQTIGDLEVRRHGAKGPTVVVLHGGPGAPGSARELAQGLAGTFQVVEPWQRGSGEGESLTVARHVADLHQVIRFLGQAPPPALVGESWGAMLALAYAAEHPAEAGPMVLVGCGTFDEESRAVCCRTREMRIDEYLATHPGHEEDLQLGPQKRIMKWHEMTDSYDPLPPDPSDREPFDAVAHTETWRDMLRCQEAGLYPGGFAAITSPVLMLHGSHDPHPGRKIRDHLKPFLPQLEYHEFARCGHHPARERLAREEFFAVMGEWLAAKCG